MMTFRWVERPRANVHVDERSSIARLVLSIITGIWLFAAAYGVVVLLLAG